MKLDLTAKKITEIIQGELDGSPDLVVNGLNRIEHGSKGDLVFISSEDYLKYLESGDPSIVILPKSLKYDRRPEQALVYSNEPYRDFVKILLYIDSQIKNTGIHTSVIIGENTTIGDNAEIKPGVVIGNNCRIGKNVKIYPNVTVYDDTEIGNNCILHSGCVIGSDGFGFVDMPDGSYLKIPQLGNVVIGNDVEIGANSCIDRAMVGSTIISDGVKIDNLVQIAHNVEIGENSAFASQVGIAGSAKIGNRVRFGGQSASVGHIKIEDDVTIIAQSGVSKGIDKKGVYFGSPAKPQREAFRIEAALRNLPDAIQQIKEINKKLNS